MTTVVGSSTQRPSTHAKVPLQRSPSSKVAQSPSPSHWHAVGSGTQLPAEQVPPAKQPPTSAQGCPSLAGVWVQPAAGSQPPVVHAPSAHASGVPAQTPSWQASAAVHAFASLHPAPLGLGTSAQTPDAGLHLL
jgi:hypothetical protein